MLKFYKKIELHDNEHELIGDLVYSKFGIVLDSKKKNLIIGRLQKIINDLDLNSFKEYYDLIVGDKSGNMLLELVDKLSTNHTYFFRELDHFKILETNVIPDLLQKYKNEPLRIWSSAVSSGEEIYTLKIVLNELYEKKYLTPNYLLLGTDISTTALSKAVSANYDGENIIRVPSYLLNKYFTKEKDNSWTFKEKHRNGITLKRLNLMDQDFPFKNKFHIIFCRNVMIYFDESTKNDLIRKFSRFLVPGGYLFVGMSESIGQKSKYFKYFKPSVYLNSPEK
ncbi:MAG: protein-glutamate O-methyltransferase CheR [Candidatus Delongbacteria bacterium]|nr:protein-glutamate O-methyltransferase CheR [Candidatus Delongbacteria bacterium]MBN2835854.1 protein-glutamate O-methyltransferase CheR [Candidatus Delongbacteria bacterium]